MHYQLCILILLAWQKGLKYEKSINPNLQYTVQAQLVQQLISGISPFQWTRKKKKKNSTALQHPSPIF